ncbi:MAG: DUF6472 family protein, partial [Oscillospiraceae bacterium]|nr:DUF6472 family protein [Oscillospiraceae bacterium]
MAGRSGCEDCMHYTYDEEFDDYTCEQDLDEDEMVRFLAHEFTSCPFYH